MEDRLNQMNAVLQAMQKTLECNICLDLLNKPLTTKCGHSFCAECIQQVLKGPRNSAQCPLCLAHVTRRSLSQNNKITNLVLAVRKIIASIKKDCCFEVTPSKYRPRRQPVISPEDDDSENEENDEPRRGTRKRGITTHYIPEIHVPKPRAKSAKQRILATSDGQELSLHTDVKVERSEDLRSNFDVRSIMEVVAKEHSYSSPTKQEPIEKTGIIPSCSRGKGNRATTSGTSNRGKVKVSMRGKANPTLITKFTKADDSRKYVEATEMAYGGGKDVLPASHIGHSRIPFPEGSVVRTEESTDHLSQKLGQEKPADKVAKWLHNSSEVGFRIGAKASSDSLSTTDSEATQVFRLTNEEKTAAEATKIPYPKQSGITQFIYPQKETLPSASTTDDSSNTLNIPRPKKFFKSRSTTDTSVNESISVQESLLSVPQSEVQTQIFVSVGYPQSTPSGDPYNFIPSQKTPKQVKTSKRGKSVNPKARGSLLLGRGGQTRVRGRGRGRGRDVVGQENERTLCDSLINTDKSNSMTVHKQSTPIATGRKINQNIDLSMIKPGDTTFDYRNISDKHPPSLIVCNHDDIHDDDDCSIPDTCCNAGTLDDHGIPDSCPVNTKDEFDVLVSETKEKGCKNDQKPKTKEFPVDEEDKEANLLFVTPLQTVEELTNAGKNGNLETVVAKEQLKTAPKKRPCEDSAPLSKPSKKSKLRKASGSDSDGTADASVNVKLKSQNLDKSKPTKQAKAREEVERICSMFEDVDTHNLNVISTDESEKIKKIEGEKKDKLMRHNISILDQTLENTKLNKSIPFQNTMPPPKAPVSEKKVRFEAPLSDECNDKNKELPSSSSLPKVDKGSERVGSSSRRTQNLRYASSMKKKLMQPNKPTALSVNVKDTKSPGWSHVKRARKDMKTRHTSLSITGGEQRSINDSRTDGGTSNFSINAPSSSEESEFTIDDRTQDFDVEHLPMSQSKNERVKKLKAIVSDLHSEEKSHRLNHTSNDVSRKNVTSPYVPSHEERDQLADTEPFVEKEVKILQKKENDVTDKILEGNVENIKDIGVVEFDDAEHVNEEIIEGKEVIAEEKQGIKSVEAFVENKTGKETVVAKDSQDHLTETEPFECDINMNESLKSGVSDSAFSGSELKKKPAKKKFSLRRANALKTDLKSEALQDKAISEVSQSKGKTLTETQDMESQGSISCSREEEVQRSVESTNGDQSPKEEAVITKSSFSNVDSHKSCIQEQNLMLDTSSSPSKVSLPHTDASIKMRRPQENMSPQKISQGHQVVPFRSVGSLCTERCNIDGVDVDRIKSLGRDLCLHAVPCEVYQVLLKYMSLLSTQQNQHFGCCGASSKTSKFVQTVEQREDESASATKHSSQGEQASYVEAELHKLKTSDLPETINNGSKEDLHHFTDSEMVPNSCNTEDMVMAIPLPVVPSSQISLKTEKANKNNAKDSEGIKDIGKDQNTDRGCRSGKQKVMVSKRHDRKMEESQYSQSLDIPVNKNFLIGLSSQTSSPSQTQDLESSQQSTSLLGARDVVGDCQSRLVKDPVQKSEVDANTAKLNEKHSERGEAKPLPGCNKIRERNLSSKTPLHDETGEELGKENMKVKGSVQPTISRSRRKPLQSGAPITENIISKNTKVCKDKEFEKANMTELQSQASQITQKNVNSSLVSIGKQKLSFEPRCPKTSHLKVSVNITTDHNLEGRDSISDSNALKSSLERSKRKFRGIREPAHSGSSSEESDSDAVQPRKRKQQSSHSSALSVEERKDVTEKKKVLAHNALDSEEIKDLERLNQGVWEFFNHADEDFLAKKDDDQNSHVSIDDSSSQKALEVDDLDELPPFNPSIPSDDEIPNTQEVMKNVNEDLELIKKMRESKKEPDLITVGSSQESVMSLHSAVSNFSVATKQLFAKVDKSLTQADNLLDSENSLFEGLTTPLLLSNNKERVPDIPGKQQTASKTASTAGKAKEQSGMKGSVDESEDEIDNISHCSAFSTQSEAISTQKQKEVKDEVEALKARVRELEAVMKKGTDRQEVGQQKEMAPPLTRPVDSGDESEELFSSLPELTESTEPKLPPSNKQNGIFLQPSKPKHHQNLNKSFNLVCTGLNSAEMAKVQDMVNRMAPAGATVKKSWTSGITHVIVKTDPDRLAQRTLKYLYGVAAGCWVITLQWALDSISKKQLLPEENYEVLDTTGDPGPRRGRTCTKPLFDGCEFFLQPPFADVTVDQLKELLELCGAKVIDSARKFSQRKQSMKLIVLQTETDQNIINGMKYKNLSVAHDWIIECIGMYARICIAPYIIGNSDMSLVDASGVPRSLLHETQEI